MKPISYGKPFMELLNQENISDHFLTAKMFKSMKFVGHCSSVPLFLFMSDVMSYLTNCSKTVQQSSALAWIYPETIDWTLATL